MKSSRMFITDVLETTLLVVIIYLPQHFESANEILRLMVCLQRRYVRQ